jgi:hypothetical protein
MLKLWAGILYLLSRSLLSHYDQCSACGQQFYRMTFYVFRQGDAMTILPSEILASYPKKHEIRARSDIVCNETRFCCLPLEKKAHWVALIGCDPNGYSPSVNGQATVRPTEVRVVLDRRHRGVEKFELFTFP